MSAQGIRTVASLELRQRVRTSRWPIVMALWVLLIGLVSALTWYAVHDLPRDRGSTLYDVVLFFVLGLGLLVVPSLTATSVNGDREHGVLATLQTTLLTPADIVLGKLVAALVMALAFLVAAGPFLVWAWIAGGVPIGRLLLAVLVMVVVLGVVCGLGLLFSSLTARTVTSVVLTYLTVAALVFGTLIAFALSIPMVSTVESVRYRGVPESALAVKVDPQGNPVQPQEPTAADCVVGHRNERVFHSERTWWLLALNPFVVVADAAPVRKPMTAMGFEPLQQISDGARMARLGPVPASTVRNECWPEFQQSGQNPDDPSNAVQRARLAAVHPVWPWGFAFLLAVGAGATLLGVRRLRTPIRRLPRGTRIA